MSTSREEKLLLTLFNSSEEYVTAQQLSDLLKVSNKTIYRLVSKINEKYSNQEMIESAVGRGYKLNHELYIKKSNKVNTSEIELGFSVIERRKRITNELLLNSPQKISINRLLSEYFISESVLYSDIVEISQEISKVDLELVRDIQGVSIEGNESDLRNAIKNSMDIFNVIDLEELKRNESLWFNDNDILFVIDQINLLEKSLLMTFAYPYNINVFSHLYILLSRSRASGLITFSQKVSDDNLEKMKDNVNIHNVCVEVITNVENYLGLILNPEEVYMLYQYIISSRMLTHTDDKPSFTKKDILITQYYIERMKNLMNIEIISLTIEVDLANHIRPMLNRLKHNIAINNALLEQIKVSYADIFSNVTIISNEVETNFNLPKISEDEIGFITIYFAQVIEMSRNLKPVKTLVVCTTGIGTSELLKAKLLNSFTNIEVVDVASSSDIESVLEKHSNIELILTTVSISDSIKIPTLLVSSMFTEDDKSRVGRKIGELRA